ncbi:MAG: translocation/assembly module TamB domain-containing protein [Marinagarivorans sp.]|nr:translocation/assembly module TamB domain-containing protein [Marinagarivorans sp.]
MAEDTATPTTAALPQPNRTALTRKSPLAWVGWGLWRLTRLLLLLLLVVLLALMGIAASLNFERSRLFWVEQTLQLLPRESLVIVADDIHWPHLGELSVGQLFISRYNQPLLELSDAQVSVNLPSLLRKRLHLYYVTVSQLTLYPPAPRPEPKPKSPFEFKIPKLPGIKLDSLAVAQLNLRGMTWPQGVGPRALSIDGHAALNWRQPLDLEVSVTEQGQRQPLIVLNGRSETASTAVMSGRIQQSAGQWLGQWLQLPPKQEVELGFDLGIEQQTGALLLEIQQISAPLLGHSLRIEGVTQLHPATNTVVIPQLVLHIDEQNHQLQGQISPEQISLAVNINQLQLDFLHLWLPQLTRGKLSAQGDVAWDWNTQHLPEGAWEIEGDVVYNKIPVALKSTLALTQSQINAEHFYLKLDEAELKLKGRVNTQDRASALTFKLTHFYDKPLRQLLPASIAAKIPAELSVHVQKLGGLVRGNWRNPIVMADINAYGRYGETPIMLHGNAAGNLRQLDINQLHAELADAHVSASGLLDWTGANTQLSGEIKDLSTALAYQHKVPFPEGIDAIVNAKWQVKGALKSPWVLVDGGVVGQYAHKNAKVPFTLRADADSQLGALDKLQVNVNTLEVSAFDRPVLDVKGYVGMKDNDMKIVAKRLPTQVLEALGYSIGEGRAEARLRLRGSFEKPQLGGYVSYGKNLNLRDVKGKSKIVPLIWHSNISSEDVDLVIDSSFTLDNQSHGQVSINLPWHHYLQFVLAKTGGSLPMSGQVKSELDVTALQLFMDTDQASLHGNIEADLTLSGTAAAPLLDGELLFKNGQVKVSTSGTALNDIQLYAVAEGHRINLVTAFARDGDDGNIKGSGYVDWRDIQSSNAIDLKFTADEAYLFDVPNATGALTGDVTVVGGMQGINVNGKFDLAPLELNIDSTPAASIPQIKVTEVFNDEDSEKEKTQSILPPVALDIIIEVANRAYIRGRGLITELAGTINVKGTATKPLVSGNFKTSRGQLKLLKKPITVNEGRAQFNNGLYSFSIPASYKAKDVYIKITISGNNQTIKMELTSIPELPQEEILSRLLFGNSVQNITALEAISLASAINTLSKGSSFNVMDMTRDKLGFDSLSIEQASEDEGGGVNVGVGKYVNERVYLEIERSSDPVQPWQGNIKIDLTSDISLESSTSGSGGTTATLQWNRDF